MYEDVAPFYLQMMGQHRYMLKHNCETAQCNINVPCQPPGGALRLWGEYNGKKYFIPSGAGLDARVFAHEFLHSCSAEDIYPLDTVDNIAFKSSHCVSSSDWGNGFQRPLASRNDIAVRTAMASNFLNGGVGYDIPADDIDGKGIGLETVK